MRTIALAIVACLAATGTARAATYEMADLKALEQQGAWQELYEHLGDILPSKGASPSRTRSTAIKRTVSSVR